MPGTARCQAHRACGEHEVYHGQGYIMLVWVVSTAWSSGFHHGLQGSIMVFRVASWSSGLRHDRVRVAGDASAAHVPVRVAMAIVSAIVSITPLEGKEACIKSSWTERPTNASQCGPHYRGPLCSQCKPGSPNPNYSPNPNSNPISIITLFQWPPYPFVTLALPAP